MHEFNLLIKQHIDYAIMRKQISIYIATLSFICFSFHIAMYFSFSHMIQQKEYIINAIQNRMNNIIKTTKRDIMPHQQSFNTEAWLKNRDNIFNALFNLQTEPINYFCLTTLQLKNNLFIMQGNSSSAALFTDTLLNSRLMRQFTEVKIHSIEEDATVKLVRFKLVGN